MPLGCEGSAAPGLLDFGHGQFLRKFLHLQRRFRERIHGPSQFFSGGLAYDALDGFGVHGLLQRLVDQRLVAASPALALKCSMTAPPRKMFTRCLFGSTAPLAPRWRSTSFPAAMSARR
jgi:hypothetical protein